MWLSELVAWAFAIGGFHGPLLAMEIKDLKNVSDFRLVSGNVGCEEVIRRRKENSESIVQERGRDGNPVSYS